MKNRVMAILLLLVFLLGLFLMAYAFIFTTGHTTLGMIGLGFVVSIGFLSYRLRKELEHDDDYKKPPVKDEKNEDEQVDEKDDGNQ